MLQISHVKKSYQAGHPVLKDITLTVQDGDLFAFIGHNGAGKQHSSNALQGFSILKVDPLPYLIKILRPNLSKPKN